MIKPENITPLECFFKLYNDPDESTIYSGVYTCFPLKEGEIITLEVENKDEKFWNVESFSKAFKIEKIEYEAKTLYPQTKTVSSVTKTLNAYIYVIEI